MDAATSIRRACSGRMQAKASPAAAAAQHRRLRLAIACARESQDPPSLHPLIARCSSSLNQAWAVARRRQQRLPGWQQSLCVGAGISAAACSGATGPPCGPGSGGGGGGGGGGGDGGGGWGSGAGGSSWSNVLADVAAAGSSSDTAVDEVILLDVGGMKCGGCVGHVRQLLEQQPGVTAATVNLATETALVRVQLQAGQDLDQLAAELAKALSKAGFASKARPRRGTGWVSDPSALTARRQQKLERLARTTQDLCVAWALSLLCGLGHLGHVWAGAPAWLHTLHHPVLAGTLSAAALLGPGRDIMVSGWQALSAGRPDMNSLVGLGAAASFGVSCVAAALPALRWRTFFEEPAMLLGFVLVGRALEERAKLQASSDMAALQGLMPHTARLTLGTASSTPASHAAATSSDPAQAVQQQDPPSGGGSTARNGGGGGGSSSWVEVPADAVGPGDVLLVLPGDRVPVDGSVVGGRSTVDESALTGEPLPLVKQTGAKVTAGTLNCDGSLLVSAEASGQDTVIADIVRMVEAAQARTAPIQRLADSVAGRFAYGVMGLSAATFAFWSTAGARLFPQVVAAAAAAGGGASGGAAAAAAAAGACCCPPAAAGAAGAAGAAAAAAGGAGLVPTGAAAVLLGLQLACNVLVVACPCALGLATPTAVLVGTAAGARKGLLVRGGDILEATSQVDTVVFDKTGTLTAGRPIVAGVTMLDTAAADAGVPGTPAGTAGALRPHSSSSRSSSSLSPSLMLQLAAAVEQQATHPVAKALVAAAAADRTHAAASSSSSGGGSTVAAEHDAQQQLIERRASHAAAGSSSSSSSASSASSSSSSSFFSGHKQQQQHRTAGRNSSSSNSSSMGGEPLLSRDAAAALAAGGQLCADAGTFRQEPGSGAVAVVSGHTVSVGTLEWVQRQGAALTQAAQQQLSQQQAASVSASAGQQQQQQQQQEHSASGSASSSSSRQEALTGHTQVWVGVDDVIVGLVDVADVIRPDAASTVQELHDQGIRTIMLSGDRREAAEKVAAAVGIAPGDVHAGIKPAGKAALVEGLRASGHRVAMVGDGINDTAALAAADVGMAMAGGVDAASDVAKVVLMGDQLHQVCDAIELSRKTLSKIQQNLGWAFCYNFVGIPLAAGALLPKYGLALTPSISGALMGFSSLAVMANSLVLQLEVRGLRNGLLTAQLHADAAAGGPAPGSSGGSGGAVGTAAAAAAAAAAAGGGSKVGLGWRQAAAPPGVTAVTATP